MKEFTKIRNTLYRPGVLQLLFVFLTILLVQNYLKANKKVLIRENSNSKECLPDSNCTCDPKSFTSMFYIHIPGTAGQKVDCGDTLKGNCKSTSNWTLAGSFHCTGTNCNPQTLTATLVKPDLSTISIPVSWSNPAFSLVISPTDLSVSGYYTLNLMGTCGTSVCTCSLIICVECCLEDFEDDAVGTHGQWQVINGAISVINDAAPHFHILQGNDGQGGSYFYNNSEYSGNWIQQYNGCFCFDIKYDANDPNNPQSGKFTLNIFNGSNINTSTLRAIFVSNTAVDKHWIRLCAPIATASTSGLPSNADGHWEMVPSTTSDIQNFNTLIQNVVGISFALDFASGSSPAEILYIDNICLEKCLDSCYCGQHKFLYSIGRGPLLEHTCGDTLLVPSSGAILPIRLFPSFSCTGIDCDTPTIDWTLYGPGNFIPISNYNVIANPNYTLPIINSTFIYPGIYTLNIIGHCGNKICPCTIYFNADGYKCCGDYADFSNLAINAIHLLVDNINCKVSITMDNVSPCDSIVQVNWGDGTIHNTHYGQGSMNMHSYTQNGTYFISFTVFEYDSTHHICFDRVFRDSVKINCNNCKCGGRIKSNLICNGDFNQTNALNLNFCSGNNPVISDYIYYTGPAIGGNSYTIGNAATVSAANGGNWVCLGINGSSDNFMIVDGGPTTNRIWEQNNIPLLPNTEYEFNMAAICIDRVSPVTDPQVDIFINNQNIGSLVAPWGNTWNFTNFCWRNDTAKFATINLKTQHNISPNDFAIDKISFTSCDKSTSTKNPIEFSSIHIYPVPVNEEINIEFTDDSGPIQQLYMVDLAGKKITFNNVIYKQNIIHLDASSLLPGIYFLHILRNDKLIAIKKIIKV